MLRWLLLVLLLMFIGLQYRLWLGEVNLRELLALKTKISEQQLENERLQLRNSQLEAEVMDLKKGLSAIEERARSGQGLVREGETFFQLVQPLPQEKRDP